MAKRTLLRRGLASQRGMTLVEIMVVIAILGTLMSVVAFGVVNALDDGNVSTTKLQIQTIEGQLQIYAAKNRGRFPSSSDGLNGLAKQFDDGRVPKDAWGNEFIYMSPGSSGAPYEIISLGKDGVEGGEDANADISSSTMGDAE